MSMQGLARFERRWASVAIGAMFPKNAHVLGAETVDVGAGLSDVCERVPFRVAIGLHIAVWLLALAPIWVLRKMHTLAGIDAAAREQVVLALLASPSYFVRQLTLLIKAFGALLFVSSPEVRASIVAPPSGLVSLKKKEVAA